MKKYLSLLLTCLVFSLSLVSCSDDDDDKNPYYDKIVGTWQIVQEKTKQSGNYMNWPFSPTYATFKANGEYSGRGYFGTGSGSWSIKGNRVSTYIEGQLYATYDIISTTSTTSELKMSIGDEALWIKCKKE